MGTEPTPVKSFVVRDDVLYLITGGTEDLAFLLARNSPVAVSALLHNNAPDDLHAAAQRMLQRAHERETDPIDTALAKHLVVDHIQPGAEIAALNQGGLVARHRDMHPEARR
jgi:hypothetical protein